MARKNARLASPPLSVDEPAPLRIVPRRLPETSDDYHTRKCYEKKAAEKAALRRMKECAWPGCACEPRRGSDPLPVCSTHAIEITSTIQAFSESYVPLTEKKLQRELRARRQAEIEERERSSRSIAPGWVYYLRVDQRIKIGYTTDVRQRMKSYPPHSELLAVHPGTKTLEREMHAQFAGHLAQGREWFRPDEPVMAHVAKVVEEFGDPPKKFIYRFREGSRQQIKVHTRSRR